MPAWLDNLEAQMKAAKEIKPRERRRQQLPVAVERRSGKDRRKR